jgi:hypothetical protein
MDDTHLPAEQAEKTPFEKFQDAFRTVLSVSKEDMDKALAEEHANRRRRTNKPKA